MENSAVPENRGQEDKVNLAIYAPSRIKMGDSFVIDVWAFLGGQRDKIEQLALRMGQKIAGEESESIVEHGSLLTLHIEAPKLSIEERTRTFVWDGHETVETFTCKLEPAKDPKARLWDVLGTVVVMVGGLRLTSLAFQIFVSEKTSEERRDVSGRASSPKTAFASYASDDRISVMRGVEGLKKAAPYMDIFIDVIALRSGDDWEKKLYSYIATSDVFYLFWSSAASESQWVDREWRLAFEKRGIQFIDPFPLESPEIVPPPKELESLHFNSLYQICVDAEKYIRSRVVGKPHEA